MAAPKSLLQGPKKLYCDPMAPEDNTSSMDDTMPQAGQGENAPPDSLEESTDLKIGGRYIIEREVGRGGVGEVYFAHHQFTGQPVAVKTLRSKWADNEAAIARFEREAKALSQLQHPNCVSVLDFGRQDNTGDWYLAMEWVEGEDFKKLIKSKGPLGTEDWVDYFKQALKALRYIHDAGILHRDIKPKNLMLTEKKGAAGVVKLVDFGFAKMTSEDNSEEGGKTLTKPGTVLGTPEYMAPEQAKGEVIDARADLFALSSVMLYCLTGRSFFRGDGIRETLTNVIRKELPPVQKMIPEKWCSDEMDHFLRKSLAKKREKRFQSAQEMLDALNQLPLKAPDHKNPWQYTDPTSQFHRAQLGQTDTRDRSSLQSQAFVGVEPPVGTEESVEESFVKKSSFPSVILVGLLGMTVVFGTISWLVFGKQGIVEEKKFATAPSTVEVKSKVKESGQVVKADAALSGAQKEKLWNAKNAMAQQKFAEARAGFDGLHKDGINSREVLTGLALSAFHLKDYSSATRAFKILMTRFPKEAAKYRPFMQMAQKKAATTE